MGRWNLSGHKAVVTGASKGIGLAIADELRGFGATVLTIARNGGDLRTDVATEAGRAQIASEVASRFGGKLDLLINNVGTNIRRKLVDYTDAEIDAIFTTNLTSTIGLCRALHPALKASGRGAVVNVASVAGLTALRSGAPYAMSKAAMLQLTKNLAYEWAPDGIRVNAVAPWYIETPLAKPVLDDPAARAEIVARTPLRRIGEPAEVAAAVAFFCLPAASYVTGQHLAVDGGFLAWGF